MLSIAVYNHYQRIQHEEDLAIARMEQETQALKRQQPPNPDGTGGSPSAHAQPLPYPPSNDAVRMMAEARRCVPCLL